jgi:hypothetical protein
MANGIIVVNADSTSLKLRAGVARFYGRGE